VVSARKFHLQVFVFVFILGTVGFFIPKSNSQSFPPLDVYLLVLNVFALLIAIWVKVGFGRNVLLLIAAWWVASAVWTVRELLRDHAWVRLIPIAIQIAVLARTWSDFRRLSQVSPVESAVTKS
jgi:hypothetical protein